MPGWDRWSALAKEELKQSLEEGKDPAAVEALRTQVAAAGEDAGKVRDAMRKLRELPLRADFPFCEPSDLEGIRAARPQGPRRLPMRLSDEALLDRLYGAWLGRCAGCALGKPVEGMMGERNGVSSKERIKRYLLGVSPDEYPLRFYFPKSSGGEEKEVGCHPSTREQIKFMESDDDIRYTVLAQKVMLRKGHGFTTWDVGQQWLSDLPYKMVCTAETQAYRNLVEVGESHMASDWGNRDPGVDWQWVATNDNPYREWIGAQIRADGWGYAAPGDPERAAEYAWRDARLSHVKNGIYGEMFCAAMIAAAFALDDPLAVVEAGLAEIPEASRLYREMRQVVDVCAKHGSDPARFEAVLDDVYALLGHYHPVHTNNNAALVVAALLLGGRDFEKVITIAVMGGLDTDCNGATAGSICGAMTGAEKLPAKWIDPLNDTLYSQVNDYHPISIRKCAELSLKIVKAAP